MAPKSLKMSVAIRNDNIFFYKQMIFLNVLVRNSDSNYAEPLGQINDRIEGHTM